MALSNRQPWERFQKYYAEFPALGLSLDLSRMQFSEEYIDRMSPRLQLAFTAMSELERGAIANPDENRMVGHYWLRNPGLAPAAPIRQAIEENLNEIKAFASAVHQKSVRGARPFQKLLVIGIGGSALGPQFVSDALGHPKNDRMKAFFFDNTDPDGMDKIIAEIGAGLDETLTLVISKSGTTKETRNGMLEAKAAYERDGLKFAKQAVAITGVDSELDRYAQANQWIKRFPMWDWVGGRTSEFSAVGLLPAALQGIDIDGLLAGAKACDHATRGNNVKANPSALLASAWNAAVNDKGPRDMVVLPYKDRLSLFPRYLQQLIMESLGKELDLVGQTVHQGISVYGNKGSTDQHSYIQQLVEGVPNFFATFIGVLKDRDGDSIFVESEVTSGDYLHGSLLGTRQALFQKNRPSLTITISDLSPFRVGVLIALYERAVGLYAQLININAYHQPGVEAGKKAASGVIAWQRKVLGYLNNNTEKEFGVAELANAIEGSEAIETIFQVCEHLAANPQRGIIRIPGRTPFEATYRKIK